MTTREKIEEIEGEMAVDKITVEKFGRTFQIYPWLKGRLFHKEITGNEVLQEKTTSLLLKQLISVFYGFWNLFRKNEIWAFTNSVERRLIDEKYYDKLFDFIGNESGKKVLIIELRLFKYYPYRKIASKRAVSKSVFMLLEELYGRLFLKLPKIQNEEELNELNDQFKSAASQNEIIRKYLSQYKMMRLWLKIIPNPKVVYMSVGYTNFGYIRAFKEKGIKVVEFQHGLITKNHSAYFYKTKFESIQFPDEIITVGECEVAVFDEENAIPIHKVIPMGSFILDHHSTKDVKEKYSSPLKVLFAMQDGVMSDKLSQFIIDLMPLVKGKAELIIQTRRTPKEDYLSKFPELANIKFSTLDFYSSLLECDIHSTVYSTTAIESLSLGRANILVNIDNLSIEQLGSKLAKNEFTTIVNSPVLFLEALTRLNTFNKEQIVESNSENVKPNYKKNILKYVNSND